jgi:hypothetical protein
LIYFPTLGLLKGVGKTKTLTVHVPMPGEGPVAVPLIFNVTQLVEHVDKFKYLGQLIDSNGNVKGEVNRRLLLAYAALIGLASREFGMTRQYGLS